MKWALAQRIRQDTPTGDAIGAALPKSGVAKKHHHALPHAEVSAAIATVRAWHANWATVAANGKLFVALLVEKLIGHARGISFSGYELGSHAFGVHLETAPPVQG